MKKFLKTTIVTLAAMASFAAFSADGDAFGYCADVTDYNNLVAQNGACYAPAGSGSSKRTDKNIYMGLVWSFGPNASKTPDVLIGARSTSVKSSNSVSGADLSVRLQSAKNFAVEGVRVSYLGGKRNAIANVGVGYSFASGSALITAAVQAAHVRAGTDYLLASKNFVPFFEVNTLKRIQPTGADYSCSNGTLRNVDYSINPSLNGMPTANGMYTMDSATATMLTQPYFPAGSKTCFVPEAAEPV